MAEYRSTHSGSEIDEAVTRALNLLEVLGTDSNKMMSQKAITEFLDTKVDKVEGKVLSSNDFTDEYQNKLTNINKTYLISIDRTWNRGSDGSYTQVIPISGIKETDVAIVNIELSDDPAIAESELQAWSKISKITMNDGNITVYCKNEIPDIVIQVKIKT